jgi:hypothetical protein
MTENNFMPEGYEVPQSSNYLKLQQGDNKVRIVSKPIVGWEDWQDNKPIRFKMTDKPQSPIDPEKAIKHFWAMLVWDYKTNKLTILEITQKGIQKTIEGLAKSEDWGSPLNYDIVISKKGEGLKTEYAVVPIPPKPLTNEIKELILATQVNLEAMFDGNDPFSTPF